MNVPVFFNKEDFYGRLLPGYATIILTNYFFNIPAISDNITATVMFIVEGPIVGYFLCSVTSYFGSLITYLKEKKEGYDYKKYRVDYAKIRMRATDRQINELESPLSTYQFCISTGAAFIVLSLIKLILLGFCSLSELIHPLLIFFAGLVLIIIAKFEYEDFSYNFQELYKEYKEIIRNNSEHQSLEN